MGEVLATRRWFWSLRDPSISRCSVNYSDLIATSLESWFMREIIPNDLNSGYSELFQFTQCWVNTIGFQWNQVALVFFRSMNYDRSFFWGDNISPQLAYPSFQYHFFGYCYNPIRFSFHKRENQACVNHVPKQNHGFHPQNVISCRVSNIDFNGLSGSCPGNHEVTKYHGFLQILPLPSGDLI